MSKLVLIDGNSFCYRAFYAIRDLTNSYGEPTNAIYGFITMLQKIIKDHKPDYLAVAFDLKGPTFRHEKYKEYKIHRKPMPDPLIEQMPKIKEILLAYGYALYEKEGFEADDIIATIAKAVAKRGLNVSIVTGDKDMLQLVGPYIKVISPNKDKLIYDTETVKERYGVSPEEIKELMSLMGDSSDNIPGVPGIGAKSAVSLIQEFGSLDNLLKNLDKVEREHLKKLIEENKDTAQLSKELATVDTNVPIDVELDSMKPVEPDRDRLFEMFKRLEFKALLSEFAPTCKKDECDYRLITKDADFDKLLKELKSKDEFALDFETTSADPIVAEPVGISFSWKEKQAVYVPIGIDGAPKDVLKRLKPILEDASISKIGQNIKYEKIIFSRHSIDLKGVTFDTMIASYLLNPSKATHGLDAMALEHLEYKMIPIEALIGKGKKQRSMRDVELDTVCEYACEDSDITFRLKKLFYPRLEKLGLYELFMDVELPLVDALSAMELSGVSIDTGLLGKMSKQMETQLDKLQKEIYEMAGDEFNINSPKQLSGILFEKLKLAPVKKTKTGFSTDEGVLQILASRHAMPALLLEYRQLTKLKSTYVDALPELVNPDTKKVHTSFNQTITATGRLSSSTPNLQNIPVKTDAGRKIRGAFTASSPDKLLICADYSQIELRVLAHISKDETMQDAFREGRDIHTHTASLIFGTEEDEVDSDMRDTAKTVNFGIVYGISAFGLSKQLGIATGKAQGFIDAYFERYPGIKNYMHDAVEQARQEGFVTTLLKRRRYIPEINSKQMTVRQFAERTAINTPIQGTAADLIKLAMINIHKAICDKKFDADMILQVHDELIFDAPKKKIDEITAQVKDLMENVLELDVPIEVSIKTGKNWLDTEPIPSPPGRGRGLG